MVHIVSWRNIFSYAVIIKIIKMFILILTMFSSIYPRYSYTSIIIIGIKRI